jgi:LmeA-like phospholipid-binding
VLGVILISGAGFAVAMAGVDRLLAAVVSRGVGRRLAAVLGSASGAAVRITSVPFLTQLVAGVYREVEVTAAAFTAGGIEFRGLSARLSQVHAPVRRLPARHGLVAGQVTAIMTIPLSVLAERLPRGLELRRRGADLAVSGRALLTPVSGTLAVTADGQRISVVPRVLGVPSLVGFVIALRGLPPELCIAALQVTDSGLEVTVSGDNVNLVSS